MGLKRVQNPFETRLICLKNAFITHSNPFKLLLNMRWKRVQNAFKTGLKIIWNACETRLIHVKNLFETRSKRFERLLNTRSKRV